MTEKDHPISSGSVKVDGLSIHYLTAGEGEPVVLLHGWPTSSYLWRNVIEPLARSRRVIAPDLPGFGLSDKPLDAPYSFDYHVGIFDSFLRRMGVERTVLVVHDLGGPVGLLWAVRNPGRGEPSCHYEYACSSRHILFDEIADSGSTNTLHKGLSCQPGRDRHDDETGRGE